MRSAGLFVYIFWVLLWPLPCLAEEARQAIQSAYDKTCEAAALKFVDGIRSIRTPRFEAYNPDGKLVDLVWERNRYDRLLATSLSVTKSAKVISFHQIDDTHATCRVREVYTLKRLNPVTGKHVPVVFESISDDEWVSTDRGWRLQRSRVRKQSESTVSQP